MDAVYICSRYRGDIEANTEKARRYSRFAVEQGVVPIAPHLLLPQFMDEATEREAALSAGLEILSRCDEVWVFGDEVSGGMAAEVACAEKLGMKIRRIRNV